MRGKVYQQLSLLNDNIKNEVSNIYMERPDVKNRCNHVLEINNIDNYLSYLNNNIHKINNDLDVLLKIIKIYNKQINDNSIFFIDYEDDSQLDKIFILLEGLMGRFTLGVDSLVANQYY